MDASLNGFRDKLERTDSFVITCELVPGRSARGRTAESVLKFAKNAADAGALDGVTITDNPGGNPSLSPDELGSRIADFGIAPVIHFTCRDSNRFGMFSRIQQLDGMGLRNLLVLTGDYPAETEAGTAKPCYDLDSVTLLCMLRKMNTGETPFCIAIPTPVGGTTDFFAGAAVACQKFSESEQMNQYYKLVKKVHNGARFIMTQLCYDARKFHELLEFAKSAHIEIPIIGSVFILREPAARFMNRGGVPGVFVSDRLYEQVKKEAASEDGGKSAALLKTAKLMAILKGLGYRGAHIGGTHEYGDVREILNRFDEIRDDWQSFVPEFDFPYREGFYVFKKDAATGLNDTALTVRQGAPISRRVEMGFFDAFHRICFKKESPVFDGLKGWAEFAEGRRVPSALYSGFEDVLKRILFDCRKCGDCALAEMAYLCPESKCPKYLRNGPCGGSERTRCEVFKDKSCVWVPVYDRLRSVGREVELGQRCVPPRNWLLDQTSSWLNFYLGRDHHEIAKHNCAAGGDCV